MPNTPIMTLLIICLIILLQGKQGTNGSGTLCATV